MNEAALVELRRLHAQLERAVLGAEAVFAELALPSTRSPERDDLVGLFQQTEAIAASLAELLDALDRELANEGSGEAEARRSPEEVRAFLLEAEPPPPSEPRRDFHPGLPRRSTAIGKLPSFYAFHCGVDNRLYEKRIPKSHAWRQSVELWQNIVYFGGMTAAGGLLSRLDRISELPGVRRRSRQEEYYPWDRDDIGELHRIARRAGFFAAATDRALLEDAQGEWCKVIDEWLRAGPSIGSAGSTILARLIDEAPPPDAAVEQRLRELGGLDFLSEEARAKARAKLK